MYFELSQRLTTNEPPEVVLEFARSRFSKISNKTRLAGGQLTVRMIEASFGSINRTDVTQVKLQRVENGYLLVSETTYRPSVWFWVLLILLLFSWVGWLIPIGFYLYQRGTVKSAIESAMSRTSNEFGVQAISVPGASESGKRASVAEQIDQLWKLKESGALSESEYESQKGQLIGPNRND